MFWKCEKLWDKYLKPNPRQTTSGAEIIKNLLHFLEQINIHRLCKSKLCLFFTCDVGGNLGQETGVQSYDLSIRSANKKFRNRLATSKSWRKSLWNTSLGKEFHAIVSVMAVKIQFNSPNMVRRSLSWPGILSTDSKFIRGTRRDVFWRTNHRRAI